MSHSVVPTGACMQVNISKWLMLDLVLYTLTITKPLVCTLAHLYIIHITALKSRSQTKYITHNTFFTKASMQWIQSKAKTDSSVYTVNMYPTYTTTYKLTGRYWLSSNSVLWRSPAAVPFKCSIYVYIHTHHWGIHRFYRPLWFILSLKANHSCTMPHYKGFNCWKSEYILLILNTVSAFVWKL
jgi:hypothetical protein